MTYADELSRAMSWLADQDRTLIVGQAVAAGGTTMKRSFEGLPENKLLEFPVAEDFQMGFCIGLSLEGAVPVCVFPRWNFMLCAANQLVNHLDRIPLYSEFRPHVIIRVSVQSPSAYKPGPQHDDDFTEAFKMMFRTVKVVDLRAAEEIVPAYQQAFNEPGATILVEHTGLYQSGEAA